MNHTNQVMSREQQGRGHPDSDIARFESGARVELDPGVPLDGYVAAQVERDRSAVALSDSHERLTYDHMWRRVASFGAALAERGVGRGATVGVCATRSVDLPVALLAIMQSGAAYCPLDPAQPARRLRRIIEQARPAAIVVAPEFESLVNEAAWGTGCEEIIAVGSAGVLGELRPRGVPPQPRERSFESGDPAYVMFTSGSTGHPKGVVVPHRGVVNRLLWMQEALGLHAGDTVLQKTPYSFDVSVWELFWPLLAGARLHLAEPEGHRDPRYLAECIMAEEVTIIHFVPSMLALFLEEPLAAKCRSLRHVVLSGEALSGSLLRRALETLAPATLWNLYGPTEASIDVTCWRCRMQPAADPVPIGAPIANVDCFVVDEGGGRVLCTGTPGELCVGGVQVALGYVGQPELTAERFAGLPWSPDPIYRTGDIVRWREDGLLDFMGRRDGQVKLNGVRIELGEIETVIRELTNVVDAAVLVRTDVGAVERLVGYVVTREAEPDEAQLRRELALSLPPHMIPPFMVFLERLPTTANGKLDRDALPPPSLRPRTASL
jgi:amino acid adenylation domain-containing protein